MKEKEVDTIALDETSKSVVKFGESFQVIVCPALILEIDKMLEAWLTRLSEQENIDLERESIGMAQEIVVAIAKKGSILS